MSAFLPNERFSIHSIFMLLNKLSRNLKFVVAISKWHCDKVQFTKWRDRMCKRKATVNKNWKWKKMDGTCQNVFKSFTLMQSIRQLWVLDLLCYYHAIISPFQPADSHVRRDIIANWLHEFVSVNFCALFCCWMFRENVERQVHDWMESKISKYCFVKYFMIFIHFSMVVWEMCEAEHPQKAFIWIGC